MSQSLWESQEQTTGAVQEPLPAPEGGPSAVREYVLADEGSEAAPDVQGDVEFTPESIGEPAAVSIVEAPAGVVSLSPDEFSALEERVLRAVELVKRERAARAEAVARAEQAEAQLGTRADAFEEMKREVDGLRAERDQVRVRVERLLGELDALEL